MSRAPRFVGTESWTQIRGLRADEFVWLERGPVASGRLRPVTDMSREVTMPNKY